MQVMVPKMEKVANVGANEPFMVRIVMGLSEILEATDFRNKEEIKEAIREMFMNGLLPAYAHLQEIKDIEQGRRERLIIDLNKGYFGFYDRLWAAYGDRMPKVAKELGYEDIGFIFTKDESFERKAKEFFDKHSEVCGELLDYLRKNKKNWQQAVVRFRNDYAQHNKLFDEDVKELFTLKAAETCFKNCWTAIEMILAELISTKLYGWAGIVEIPEAERDPAMPKRFRIKYRINEL